MGAYINFTNRIHVADKTSYFQNGQLFAVGYNDLTDEFITQVANDKKIKYIQISDIYSKSVFEKINKLFQLRPDMYFRIFGLYGNKIALFDFSVLRELTNVKKYIFEIDLKGKLADMSFEFISDIQNLKSLRLNLFDWYDYSFINNLPDDLEELSIYADTMGKTIQFDCKWLLKYDNLKSLSLGKKAKKNLQEIGKMKSLRELYLRGIKVNDFSFLFDLPLDSFHLLWCGNDDLSQLSKLSSLKQIELWRIMKLTNIDFLSQLNKLEVIKLQDLKHITTLPDLSHLNNLKEIIANNIPLDYSTIDEQTKKIIKKY